MLRFRKIFVMGFFFASFAIPNATLAWSDKIIVKEHDIITNKIELPTGLTFELSKDFLVTDDIVTNLIQHYQEGDAKYFFARIGLGLFTFASLKFEALDSKIVQENLVDLDNEQLENYFQALKDEYMKNYSAQENFTLSDFSGEKIEKSNKVFLLNSHILETDNQKLSPIDDGVRREIILNYAYYDYPNGFSMTVRGISNAKATLKSHAERIIDSLVFP